MEEEVKDQRLPAVVKAYNTLGEKVGDLTGDFGVVYKNRTGRARRTNGCTLGKREASRWKSL